MESEQPKPVVSPAPKPNPESRGEESGQEGQDVGEEIITPAGSAQFRCEVCSKEFSTAKALGGHKRIHSKGKSKRGKKGSKLKNKIEKEPITTCYCGKEFASEKALSGHLRMHKAGTQKGIIRGPEGEGNAITRISPSLSSAAVEDSSERQVGNQDDNDFSIKIVKRPKATHQVISQENSLDWNTNHSHIGDSKDGINGEEHRKMGTDTDRPALQEPRPAAVSPPGHSMEQCESYGETGNAAAEPRRVLDIDLNKLPLNMDWEE